MNLEVGNFYKILLENDPDFYYIVCINSYFSKSYSMHLLRSDKVTRWQYRQINEENIEIVEEIDSMQLKLETSHFPLPKKILEKVFEKFYDKF
ncbi:MAG: hypothetical protein ABIP51_08305 [Bacteroidia bacterium]